MKVSRRGAGLWLFCGWTLFFAPQLLSGGVPFYRDQLVTNLPIRAYLRARLLSGELPQWFPHEALGVPFIGQLVTQTFHPLSWLLLPLPAPEANLVAVLLAVAQALWGSYRFARCFEVSREAALAAALAFGFGGYTLGLTNNLVYLLSHATLPLVGWAAHRVATRRRGRDVGFLGVAIALTFLAGDAQGALLAGALMLAVALVVRPPRAGWLLLVAGGALALGLAAAELLPGLVVSAESARRLEVLAPNRGLVWAFSPLRIPELLLGGYLPDAVRFRMVQEWLGDERTSVWSTTLTFGAAALLPLVLGAKARARQLWPVLALLLLSTWLALGSRGGLLSVLTAVVPPLGWFRYPEKYLSLAWVAAVPLVAAGVDLLRTRPAEWTKRVAIAAGVLLVLGVLLGVEPVVAQVLSWRSASLAGDAQVVGAVAGAWRHGALVAGVALALGSGLLWATRRFSWAPSAWGAVIFAELLVANGAHLPLVRAEVVDGPNPFAEAVLEHAGPEGPARTINFDAVRVPLGVTLGTGEAWVTASRRSLAPSVASIDGVTAFKPNLPLVHWRMAALRTAVTARPALLPRFHVCFGTSLLANPASGTLVAEDAEVGVRLTRWSCRERAFLSEARPVVDAEEAAKRVGTDGATWWEGGRAVAEVAGTLTWKVSKPEQLVLEVEAPAEAALVVLDQYASGWSATIDGAATEITPVDLAARGVVVPAGRHLVEFRYQTPRLVLGLWVSGLCWLTALGLLMVPGRGRLRAS